ncbi:MAG: TonB-dependent receptor [Bacteriovoracaceae bacterium]|jgi:hypothetical protein|nr:TonB-dependent receptor [Bacteriovoracaceae bacterium]
MSFSQIRTPKQKALEININHNIYGSFAEIGAGQEVARCFFQAGGAAGTVAKTMSAYDMTISDIIYGKDERYVSVERLCKMLNREFTLLVDRLSDIRGDQVTFFAFADTMSAKAFSGNKECNGWMGVRFQHQAKAAASELIIHVSMFDRENVQQQEAVGALGVNLIHSCFYNGNNHKVFICSLMDSLSNERINIDMIKIKGPAFKELDQRILSLELVKQGFCRAVMFDEFGQVLQATDAIYKKNILVSRGSFRPTTLVNLDMLQTGLKQCKTELVRTEHDHILVVPEISMSKLMERGEVDTKDYLARIELLTALKYNVLITNFNSYYSLNRYLTTHNRDKKIFFITGIYNLRDILDSSKHKHLQFGLMGSLGTLFGHYTKLYIYPSPDDRDPSLLIDLSNMKFQKDLHHLVDYLKANKYLVDVGDYEKKYSSIWSRTVLKMIQSGDPDWEKMVPKEVAETVKTKKLFGHKTMLLET